MDVPSIITRSLAAIVVIIIIVLPATVMFFAPVLWPFVVYLADGYIISVTTFVHTLVAMVVAWALLFITYRGLVVLQSWWDYEDKGPIISPAFTQAAREGDELQAAWILFCWHWKRLPAAFGRNAHG